MTAGGLDFSLSMQILRSMPCALYVVDLNSDKLTIIFANSAFARNMGAVSGESIIGRTVDTLFHSQQPEGRTKDDVAPIFVQGMQEKGWHKAAVNYARDDGSAFEVDAHVVVTTHDGKTYAIAFVDDSARVEREAEKKRQMVRLAAQFEASVGQVVDAVKDSSGHLASLAATLSSTSQHSSHRSHSTAEAAEDARRTMAAMSSATEELGSSIQEILRQVDGSSAFAQNAVD